jgi:hypothetical protein
VIDASGRSPEIERSSHSVLLTSSVKAFQYGARRRRRLNDIGEAFMKDSITMPDQPIPAPPDDAADVLLIDFEPEHGMSCGRGSIDLLPRVAGTWDDDEEDEDDALLGLDDDEDEDDYDEEDYDDLDDGFYDDEDEDDEDYDEDDTDVEDDEFDDEDDDGSEDQDEDEADDL